MAQFEPKKLNIGEINGGNRFNNGDGVSAEAINAPIEAALYAEEIAKEAIGVKEQVQDHEERIAQTEYDTKMLYAIASQKGLYAVEEVEQAYTSRVTANGENIVDGQKTPVTLIKGSTVRYESLIPYPYRDTNNDIISFPHTRNGVTLSRENEIITLNGTNNQSDASILVMISPKIKLTTGTTYYICGCPFGGGEGKYSVLLNIYNASGSSVREKSDFGSGATYTAQEGDDTAALYIRVYPSATLSNVQFKPYLKVGTEGQWQPYFTDLKHAKIDSIVSTSGNLFNPALLDDYVAREGNLFYFNVNPVTVPQITLFDEPKNIYTKVKYKQFDETNNSRGVVFQFVKSDGSITEMSTYLNKDGESAVYIENVVGVKFSYGSQSINRLGDFIISTVDIPYPPYNKSIYQLPETLELPEFDSFNPQTGEIVRGTKELVLDGTENWFLRSNNVGDTQSFAFYFQDVTSTNLFVTNSTDLKETNYGGIVNDLNEAITVFQNVILVYAPSKFSTLDEWKAYLADLYAKGTPLTVEYELATPTVEKFENAPKAYIGYNQGNEAVVNENEMYRAIPTITNEYIVVL